MLKILLAFSWINAFTNVISANCDEFTNVNTTVDGLILMEYSNGYETESIVSFSCEDFFFLSGSTAAECSSDNNWVLNQENPPQCSRSICSYISAPDDGDLSCTFGMKTGSVCKFTCKNGYLIEGLPVIQCSATKQWTNSVPICKEKSCPVLSVPLNAKMNCTNAMQTNSECRFTCNEGFTLTGTPATLCDASNLQWSNDAPLCLLSPCPAIELTNGDVTCTDSVKVSSVCTFTCDEEYYLEEGVTETTCVSGTWSNKIPTCKTTSCDVLPNLPNGNVECTDGNKLRSACVLSCSAGFTLKGEGSIECIDSQWTHEVPDCARAKCPQLDELMRGTYTCTEQTLTSSECTYSCHPNYFLVGENPIVCGNNSRWNLPQPKCEVCKDPPCMQDLMVVLDISAASSEQNFRQQIDWLLKVLASYQGPVEVGDVQVGVMRVLSNAPLLNCGTEIDDFKPEIIVDLKSGPLAKVVDRVKELKHIGGCPGTLASVKHAVHYFNVVGRSPDKVKRVILLLSNNHDQVALKRSQGYAKSEGVEIQTAKVGRSSLASLKETSDCSSSYLSDDEQPFNINDLINSKGTSHRVFLINFWLRAILVTIVTHW